MATVKRRVAKMKWTVTVGMTFAGDIPNFEASGEVEATDMNEALNAMTEFMPPNPPDERQTQSSCRSMYFKAERI